MRFDNKNSLKALIRRSGNSCRALDRRQGWHARHIKKPWAVGAGRTECNLAGLDKIQDLDILFLFLGLRVLNRPNVCFQVQLWQTGVKASISRIHEQSLEIVQHCISAHTTMTKGVDTPKKALLPSVGLGGACSTWRGYTM